MKNRHIGGTLFGTAIAAYLFFGGTGAGACCVLSVMTLNVPRDAVCRRGASLSKRRPIQAFSPSDAYRHLFGSAFAASFVVLAAGAILLVSDVGTASAPLLLAANPTPTLVSFGAFVLAAALALSAALGLIWGVRGRCVGYRVVRLLEWAMLVDGLALAAYTGLLLSSMPAVPIWHTPWLPVLFVASSLSCGCALVVACACLSGSASSFRTVIGRASSIDIAILVAEALAAIGFVITALSSPYEVAVQGAHSLLSGTFGALFLLGFAAIGLVVPVVVESAMAFLRRRAPGALLIASSAVLAGGFALRYCIVAVGAHPEVWTVIQ